METPTQEKHIREGFLASILLKGLISLGEIAGGLLFFIVPSQDIPSWVGATSLFIAIFLLSRGLIKVGLIIALLKNWLWAYPASLWVLALFVVYQVYLIATEHSLVITGITLFDLVVIYFIWREYRIVREHVAVGYAV